MEHPTDWALAACHARRVDQASRHWRSTPAARNRLLAFTRQADRGDPGQERRARVARHPQRQRRVGLELHAALIRARQHVTFRIMCRSFFELTAFGLECADDQALRRGRDQLRRQGGLVVDVCHTLDLSEHRSTKRKLPPVIRTIVLRTLASVPSCNSRPSLSCCDWCRMTFRNSAPPRARELVDEADPRVQLRVAREPLLEAGHADEHQTDVATIVHAAQLLEPSGLRRSASSTMTRSGGSGRGRCAERSWSRLARPNTAAQIASISRSTMRGVLVTPGVYRTVRQGPLSRAESR
jgi:hypothetical protein